MDSRPTFKVPSAKAKPVVAASIAALITVRASVLLLKCIFVSSVRKMAGWPVKDAMPLKDSAWLPA
jgi:hypothetical protein